MQLGENHRWVPLQYSCNKGGFYQQYPRVLSIFTKQASVKVIPETFNEASVIPLHKNKNKKSTNERGNYRPRSVLPILSKHLERHVASA